MQNLSEWRCFLRSPLKQIYTNEHVVCDPILEKSVLNFSNFIPSSQLITAILSFLKSTNVLKQGEITGTVEIVG